MLIFHLNYLLFDPLLHFYLIFIILVYFSLFLFIKCPFKCHLFRATYNLISEVTFLSMPLNQLLFYLFYVYVCSLDFHHLIQSFFHIPTCLLEKNYFVWSIVLPFFLCWCFGVMWENFYQFKCFKFMFQFFFPSLCRNRLSLESSFCKSH